MNDLNACLKRSDKVKNNDLDFSPKFTGPRGLRGILNLLLFKYKDAADDIRADGLKFEKCLLLYLAERKAYNEAAAHTNMMLYKKSFEASHNDGMEILMAQYALNEMTADELVDRVTRNIQTKKRTYYDQYDLGETYFIIGMMEYFSGLKIGSKKFFAQCMKSLQPGYELYQIAKVMMKDSWQ